MRINEKLYLNLAIIIALFLTTAFTYAQVSISGTITDEFGNPLVNVPVFLGGDTDEIQLTGGSGDYEFSVTQGGNYNVTAYYDDHHLNGVSTLDAVLISKHFEGTQLLDSPYKIIAADVDKSGVVDMGDTAVIRDALLFVIEEFPNNTSWRFVSANFVFPNPMDPFETVFPEIVAINNIQNDMTNVDFIGIKVGDVTNSNVNSSIVFTIDPCDFSCGHVSGSVFYDLDENCAFDSQETMLQSWLITASTGNTSYHGTTNQFGEYSIPLFPATYEITITPPNNLWGPCQFTQTVTVEELGEYTVDFPVQSTILCPAMEVELATPFLRRCFDGVYAIQYCNQGTEVAIDASVEVTFDSFLIINTSSIPWTSQDGNTYTFDLGDVEVNECDYILVGLTVSCDAVLGQTFCSEAHIYPDSLCLPPPAQWDGSDIEISGTCDGDSIYFEITNIGEPMTQPVQYIVIEDDMIMMTGETIQLGALQTQILSFPANGSTWRVEVDQSSDHPVNEILSAAVEGCGQNGNGTFSLGFVTQFPQFTAGSFIDVDCVEGIGSFDPNDKNAHPKGVGDQHYIERDTELEYLIRFQNTGTDTAFFVVIKDTLSGHLDLATVRPGASSHDYSFKLLGENVLEFSFPNIMLPDSNVNEAASHGFVSFKVAQRTDLPLETLIENSAAIYFDFNDPVITNTVFHTIGENFLEVVDHIIEEAVAHFEVNVFPNPMQETATVLLDGIDMRGGTFVVYDLLGRPVHQQDFSGNIVEFSRGELKSGMYLFEILKNNRRLSTGKLLIQPF